MRLLVCIHRVVIQQHCAALILTEAAGHPASEPVLPRKLMCKRGKHCSWDAGWSLACPEWRHAHTANPPNFNSDIYFSMVVACSCFQNTVFLNAWPHTATQLSQLLATIAATQNNLQIFVHKMIETSNPTVTPKNVVQGVSMCMPVYFAILWAKSTDVLFQWCPWSHFCSCWARIFLFHFAMTSPFLWDDFLKLYLWGVP